MSEEYSRRVQAVQNLAYYRADYWDAVYGVWPVYPFCVEESVRDNRITFSEKKCRYMLICMVLEGQMLYSDGKGGEYLLDAGKLFVVPSGASYSFSSTQREYYRKLVLEVEGPLLEQAQEMMGFDSCRFIAPDNFDLICDKMRGLHVLLQNQSAENVASLIAGTWEVMATVSGGMQEQSREARIASAAKGWLEKNLSPKFTVKRLAAELGVCHSLLDRIFREEEGVGPQQYRIEHRHRQAKYYLAHTTYSIKEISARLGYGNQLYFSNEFKKMSGMSPTRFRKHENLGKA